MSNDREAVLLALEEAAQEIADKVALLREVLKEDALACLSNTHQQLDEVLAEREACAVLIENLLGENPDLSEVFVAAEIRERGKK